MSSVITQSVNTRSAPHFREKANFLHLYWDVAWYGVVFGSTLSFLPIFAARLEATGWQLGLLTAGPALVNVLFTFPAGHWIERQSLYQAVVQTAFWQRLGFFGLIPLPFILPPAWQVGTALLLILLIAIPGTALAIAFNAMLATTVPAEHRGKVIGRRNALVAATTMATFLLCGWLLDSLGFEGGYALVFTLGAIGGGLSTYHLSRLNVPATPPHFEGKRLVDHAQPGRGMGFTGSTPRTMSVGLRLMLSWQPNPAHLFAGVERRYHWLMLAFFLFHFTQFLPGALFPIFWVHEAKLTDGQISWINAAFYTTMLIASPLLAPMTRQIGNYRLTAGGAVALSLYPLLISQSHSFGMLLMTNILGGVVWGILNGALINRLLEQVPERARATHMALYNMALNVATLLGTMAGPLLADVTGLREALLIIFVLRLLSGLAMFRWG